MSTSPAIVLPGETTRRRVSPFALGLQETLGADLPTPAVEPPAGRVPKVEARSAGHSGARVRLTPQEIEARAQQRADDDDLDVHQEAFIKAYRHLSNFRFECSFYTWLYRIVTNLCLDQLRRRKSRREDPGTVLDSSGEEMDLMANVQDDRATADPDRELERKHQYAAIQSALNELTPRERTVFELKHYQGLKLRTIGEMLSTTEETAKNTLFRATRKLRARLAEVR